MVQPVQLFRSETKSSRTLHKYHAKEVRAHSGAELGTWIGWVDQLTHSRTFHRYRVKEVRAHSGTELGKWIGMAHQLAHSLDRPMFLPHFHSRMRTSMKIWN